MDWEPISRESLEKLVTEGLAQATPVVRDLFARAAVTPSKWQLSPWGDLGGGFWVVAVVDYQVVWYNDIEEGFNVSRFIRPGTIPPTEYWCNQDALPLALEALVEKPQARLGRPEALS